MKREIVELICEILNELPDEKKELYVNKWNKIVDKNKEWFYNERKNNI